MEQDKLEISYFSDVLCVWGYVSQIRLNELREHFAEQVAVKEYLITLFGDTPQRIGEGWKQRGGYEGFAKHVEEVVEQFPHVELSPKVWRQVRPLTSSTSHLLLKAVQLAEDQHQVAAGSFEQLAWAFRAAFFRDARDIGQLRVLRDIATEQGLDSAVLDRKLDSGEAFAALCHDMSLRERYNIEGSPTWLLNGARQKLYGNVGYKIIEANVQELLERPVDKASWC